MGLTGTNFFVIKKQIGHYCTCLSKHGFLSVLPQGKHLCLEAHHHWHATQGPSARLPVSTEKKLYIYIFSWDRRSKHNFFISLSLQCEKYDLQFCPFCRSLFSEILCSFRSALGFPFASLLVISKSIFNFIIFFSGWKSLVKSNPHIFFFYKRSLIWRSKNWKSKNT